MNSTPAPGAAHPLRPKQITVPDTFIVANRGKELPDPEKLLQGSGKQTRLIDVEGASTLARPAVARLIDEAIARNRVPFEPAGRGSVVLRSASAKPRKAVAGP